MIAFAVRTGGPGLGINVVGIKLTRSESEPGRGSRGVLIAFEQANVQFASFDVFSSVHLVQYGVIGGLGWVSGVSACDRRSRGPDRCLHKQRAA